MKWPAIGYLRVSSLQELWEAQRTHGTAAQILAGGQTLLATLAFRLAQPGVLLDITRIPELRGIALSDGLLRIGALTRHAELGRDPLIARHAPLIAAAVPYIAHPAIRNRGTIGGSLAYADPAAELPACAVALDATLHLLSAQGERRVKAESFFTGLFSTALAQGEIIAAVEVPLGSPAQRSTILEVARRSGDYAMAGIAAVLELDAAGRVASPRLTFFGVGSGPVLARRANAALAGRVLDEAAIAAAAEALEGDLDPPGDLHGPPELKRHLARVLLRRALAQFLPAREKAA
ncbi:MAG: xanthine dehydrogenase family protein subunit M [Rhodovarius sp.]|nr:xanthine dehydrogenase family protein subunit M [Rhodovarius sp.]